MHRKMVLIGSICGVLASMIFLILFFIAWSMSPWFILGQNYLSDLGVGEGAWAFNAGVIIAGILAIPFGLSLWYTLRPGCFSTFGSAICILAGIALVGVGVFTEDSGYIHYVFSVAFFSLAVMFQLLLAYPLIRSPRTSPASYLVATLTAVSLIAVSLIGPNPLGESIATFEILLWVLIVGIQMLVTTLRE